MYDRNNLLLGVLSMLDVPLYGGRKVIFQKRRNNVSIREKLKTQNPLSEMQIERYHSP